MLDTLGAMALTSIAILCVGALILTGERNGRVRSRLALPAAAWFVGIASLAGLGVFSSPTGLGTPAIGAAVVAPVIAGLIAFARSRTVSTFALGIPLAVLVGVHVGRILGGFFLALHAAGRLPTTFALTAGWGDILVAATAAPLALAIHRRVPGWRRLTLVWNSIAILDLVTAVSLGVGSAPGSPVRFIFENPNSGAIAALPWLMIPGFLVPIYMLTHLAIFARVALSATNEDRFPLIRPATATGSNGVR
jgi:hypothetical protein